MALRLCMVTLLNPPRQRLAVEKCGKCVIYPRLGSHGILSIASCLSVDFLNGDLPPTPYMLILAETSRRQNRSAPCKNKDTFFWKMVQRCIRKILLPNRKLPFFYEFKGKCLSILPSISKRFHNFAFSALLHFE